MGLNAVFVTVSPVGSNLDFVAGRLCNCERNRGITQIGRSCDAMCKNGSELRPVLHVS